MTYTLHTPAGEYIGSMARLEEALRMAKALGAIVKGARGCLG